MTFSVRHFLCKTYNEEKKFNEELKITAIWLKHLDFLVKLRGVALVNGPLCSAHLARVNALIGLKRYEEAEEALGDAEKYHLLYPTSLSKFYVNIFRAEIYLAKNQPVKALATRKIRLRAARRRAVKAAPRGTKSSSKPFISTASQGRSSSSRHSRAVTSLTVEKQST